MKMAKNLYFTKDHEMVRKAVREFVDKEINPNGIVTEDWPLTSSSITQIITRNSLNHAEFPTMGSKFSLSTEFAGGMLGGNVNYVKNQFRADKYMPLAYSLVLRTNAFTLSH